MTGFQAAQPSLRVRAFTAEAVLFDMDGVLTINGRFHGQAWRHFARKHLAIELAEDDPRIHGGRNAEILRALTGRIPDAEALRLCHAVKEGYYRDLARGNLQPVPGLHPYLDWLSRRDVPCGLVTSADVVSLSFVLDELGLANRFRVQVAAEDVQHGKPDPEPYLLGAKRICKDPKLCLVHEDAPLGVRSALSAGCQLVALTTTLAAPVLEEAGACLCVPDFIAWMSLIGAS